MYRFIVRQVVRRVYAQVNAGNADAVVSMFAPEARFQMMGDHPLGGERRGRDAVAAWFRETFERFPGIELVPEDVMVSGGPWNMCVAVRFAVSAPALDGGEPYRNAGMQFLRLRWGRAVEDRLYEDTQVLAAELERRQASRAPA